MSDSREDQKMISGEESNPWRDEIVRTILGDVGMIRKVGLRFAFGKFHHDSPFEVLCRMAKPQQAPQHSTSKHSTAQQHRSQMKVYTTGH